MDTKFLIWFIITFGFVWMGVNVVYAIFTNATVIKLILSIIISVCLAEVINFGSKLKR